MQNIDKKVTLILNLNKKVQRKSLIEINIKNALNIPALKDHVNDLQNGLNKISIIENVLVNTNYLNY